MRKLTPLKESENGWGALWKEEEEGGLIVRFQHRSATKFDFYKKLNHRLENIQFH